MTEFRDSGNVAPLYRTAEYRVLHTNHLGSLKTLANLDGSQHNLVAASAMTIRRKSLPVDKGHRTRSQTDKRFHRPAKPVAFFLFVFFSLVVVSPIEARLQSDDSNTSRQQRTGVGLIALYEFSEGSGKLVKDTSDVGRPVNLTIKTPKAVKWVEGGLEITGKANIISNEEPKKLVEFPHRSGEERADAFCLHPKSRRTREQLHQWSKGRTGIGPAIIAKLKWNRSRTAKAERFISSTMPKS